MSLLVCPVCGASCKAEDSAVWTRCTSCQAMVFADVDGPRILFAHESEEVSAQAGAVLSVAGFQALRAGNGRQARQILDSHAPGAAVFDVGLVDVLAFDLVQHIRASEHLSGTKVVLVASVFNKTAYKRRPSSLYGADDYVEQHHIPDMLPEKLRRLLGMSGSLPTDDIQTRVDAIRNAAELAHLQGDERAHAIARRIVGDIALYHQEEVDYVMAGGKAPVLEEALEEGRRVFNQSMGLGEPGATDPVGEAFAQFIEELRKQN